MYNHDNEHTQVFEFIPPTFKPSVEVTACYIEQDENLLLLKRGPNQPCPGTWGLPAGKLEEGENIHSAMTREIYEEIGLLLEEKDLIYLGPTYVMKKEVHFNFHMFYYSPKKSIEVVLSHEHVEHRWVTPQEARRMDLIPGGIESLEIYCRRKSEL